MIHPVFEHLVHYGTGPATDVGFASEAGAGMSERVKAPKTLILLAHPDDETLGSSTLLAALGAAGPEPAVRLIHVTDGAPRGMGDARRAGCASREAYAALRRAELDAALAHVGLGSAVCGTFDLVDQEAWRHLGELARAVAAVIREVRPALVVTHPYEGGHPDHDATAFAAHAACALIARDGGQPPALVEQTSYFADPRPEGTFVTSEFVPVSALVDPTPPVTVVLDEPSRVRKAAMYASYRSQAGMVGRFPIAVERFRAAPWYDFTRPPQVARIWYERLGWPMKAVDLCEAAAAAAADLELPELARTTPRP